MGLALLLVALLAVAPICCGAGAEQASNAADLHFPGGTSPDIPVQFVLTNDTLVARLDALATPKENAIIFTTMRFGDGPTEEVTSMVANFCFWLHRHGLLGHTMLLTTDEGTFRHLHAAGLPAYLDRVLPRRHEYIDNVKPWDTWNREFDVQKHWWGMRLVELGYRAMYSDSDAVFLQHPLAPFRQAEWEVQGLSDWFDPELAPTGGAIERHCNLYVYVKEPRVALGAALRENWHIDDWAKPMGGGRGSELLVPSPCQSTGLWYLQPTPMTVRFMRRVVQRIAWEAVWEWDQTAWNDVIVAFLWGMGNDGQLRYRLLPVEQYANVGIWEGRKKARLPVDPVVLHAGVLHGAEKIGWFQNASMWQGTFRQDARRPYFHGSSTAGGSGGGGLARGSFSLLTTLLALLPCTLLVAWGVRRWLQWRTGTGAQFGGKPSYVSVLPVVSAVPQNPSRGPTAIVADSSSNGSSWQQRSRIGLP